jgi:hypothetical protein
MFVAPLIPGSTTLFSGGTDGTYDGTDSSGLNTDNMIAVSIDTGTGGNAYQVQCRMGGSTAPVNVQGCVWNSAGTLLVASAVINVAAGTHVSGGQPLTTFSFADTAVGGIVYADWYRDPAGDSECSVGSAFAPQFVRSTCVSATPCAHALTACGAPLLLRQARDHPLLAGRRSRPTADRRHA